MTDKRGRAVRSYEEILEIVVDRKGSLAAVEEAMGTANYGGEPEGFSDDRWLACMTKCIFQAGFNWKVVDSMWPGFEAAFDGFDPGRCAMLHDEDFERLVSDKRIVRHGAKIRTVQHNAVFINELAKEYGSADKAFKNWPGTDYVGLLQMIKKRGARLGGNTGMYCLRFMGVDSFLLSRDVTARLIAEGVVDKAPTSQKALQAVQEAFNSWQQQSGRSLTEISRLLAMSTG
ncbi:DNA-3-methyladenine glycosylase I [Rhodovibrionaceae bacterium A322]